jgi:hypothetical protein
MKGAIMKLKENRTSLAFGVKLYTYRVEKQQRYRERKAQNTQTHTLNHSLINVELAHDKSLETFP